MKVCKTLPVKKAIKKFSRDYPGYRRVINKYIDGAVILDNIRIPIDEFTLSSRKNVLNAVKVLALYITSFFLIDNVYNKLSHKNLSKTMLRVGTVAVVISSVPRAFLPVVIKKNMLGPMKLTIMQKKFRISNNGIVILSAYSETCKDSTVIWFYKVSHESQEVQKIISKYEKKVVSFIKI